MSEIPPSAKDNRKTAKLKAIVQRLNALGLNALGGVLVLGPAAIYTLSHPIDPEDGDQERVPSDHVFISTSTVMGLPETYAFPCSAQGEWESSNPLDGSMKGHATHEQVLANMGYTYLPPCSIHEDCRETIELGYACIEARLGLGAPELLGAPEPRGSEEKPR